MGGHARGEVASGYVVEEVCKWFQQEVVVKKYRYIQFKKWNKRFLKKAAFRLFSRINRELMQYGQREKILLGTTASVLLCFRNRYCIFHIGDSKILQCHTKVKQVTREHAINAYILTRCLGINEDSAVDFLCGKIRRRTSFLVCSDGFTNRIAQKEIFKACINRSSPKEIRAVLEEIGARCILRGEKDNLSAIYLRYKDK